MIDWWLIPVLLVFSVVLWALYVLVSRRGGSGERTDGRTLVDKPDEEDPPTE
jgi:hypothetical protein